MARLVGEAGVTKVLCIAGDLDHAAGPFAASTDVIATGVFAKHGIGRVGIAGYPEGHGKIALPVLAEHMAKKLELLAEQNIAALIVSQFCFEAAPILDFRRARARARRDGADPRRSRGTREHRHADAVRPALRRR